MEFCWKSLRFIGMCLLAVVVIVAGAVHGFVEGLVKGLAPLPGEIIEAAREGYRKGRERR